MNVRWVIPVFLVILFLSLIGLSWNNGHLKEHVGFLSQMYSLDANFRDEALSLFWGDKRNAVMGGTLIYMGKDYVWVWRKFGPWLYNLHKYRVFAYWKNCLEGGSGVNFADYDVAIGKARISRYITIVPNKNEDASLKIFFEHVWKSTMFNFLINTIKIECGQ